MDFKREVPMDLVKQLQFITGIGHARVRFEPSDRLDRQTMRGVRELTPESASLLDRFLQP